MNCRTCNRRVVNLAVAPNTWRLLLLIIKILRSTKKKIMQTVYKHGVFRRRYFVLFRDLKRTKNQLK